MNLDLFQMKAKHSLAGLTLSCTTMAPCAMAQNQSNEDDDKAVRIEASSETDTISVD